MKKRRKDRPRYGDEGQPADLAEETHGVTDYPLRKPEEDQRWAVNTVRLWMGCATASIVFILTLLVLGVILYG